MICEEEESVVSDEGIDWGNGISEHVTYKFSFIVNHVVCISPEDQHSHHHNCILEVRMAGDEYVHVFPDCMSVLSRDFSSVSWRHKLKTVGIDLFVCHQSRRSSNERSGETNNRSAYVLCCGKRFEESLWRKRIQLTKTHDSTTKFQI